MRDFFAKPGGDLGSQALQAGHQGMPLLLVLVAVDISYDSR